MASSSTISSSEQQQQQLQQQRAMEAYKVLTNFGALEMGLVLGSDWVLNVHDGVSVVCNPPINTLSKVMVFCILNYSDL